MQFNSIEFLFCFLPVFLAVYWVFPAKGRKWVLSLGSLAFYGLSCQWNLLYLSLLAGLTVAGWLGTRLLHRYPRGWLLAAWLAAMTGILGFFKVFRGGSLLAVGMSFYLFQIAACLIDTFRGKLQPEGFGSFAAGILMFPKLLSGPLVELGRLQSQQPAPSAENLYHGLGKLILGLGMKVILANRLGGLWGQVSAVGYESISPLLAWMAVLSFAMQLFLDFQGYSLMAIGLGQMLGYQLPRNFLDPYAAKSVSEFYRRWHATLGAWFRDYVYIPLGGSRRGTGRTILNLALVWLLTGLWHGVGGNYLIWAGFLCLLIINERLWLGKQLKKTRVLGHLYTLAVILISWIPFAVGDFHQMLTLTGRLFGLCGKTLNSQDFLLWGGDYLPLLALGGLCMTPLPEKLCKKLSGTVLGDILLVAVFWLAVYGIATAAQDPFLYYQY